MKRLLACGFAYTQRIGGELEIPENIASRRVAGALSVGAVDLADDIGVRHACVLENHFRILVEAPAALVENLADPKTGSIAGHQKQRDTIAQTDMRVGPDVEEEQLANIAVGDEGFLAVQNPLVAVAFRAQFDA